MIDLGLTRAEQEAYERGLAVSHNMQVRVRILDRNEDPVSSLTAGEGHLLDGAVDVDTSAVVSRQARLTLLDPKGRLDLDPNSPADEALWIDKMVAIERHDWIDELDGYVEAPVFWGPLTHYERSGRRVELEALGKEALALDPNVVWKSLNFRKGARVTYVIRRLLREQGETRFTIPDGIGRRLPKRMSVGKMAEAWPRVQRLCRTLDRQGFYDGLGRFRIRRYPENPVFRFRKTPSGVWAPGEIVTGQGPTNLVLWSEQFANAYWTKWNNTTVVSDAVAAPDGSVTADKLVESTGTSTKSFSRADVVTAGAPAAWSVHAKATERTWAVIYLGGGRRWVNLTTGALGAVTGGAITVTVENVGDGWWRIMASTQSAGNTTVGLEMAPSDGVNNYAGDGVSGLYVWGAQAETGTPSSSYVKTEGATASLPQTTQTDRDYEPAFLVADPTYSFDFERVRNVVEVLGKDPKGKTRRVRAVAIADRAHPLSPWSLGRNDQPRFMVHRIENDKLGKQAAQRVADRTLRRLLRSELDWRGESLPVPHLEELDVIEALADRSVEVPLTAFTIPLTAEDAPTMSLGFTKRQKYRSRKKKGGRR